MKNEIEKYKIFFEDEFNKLVCNKTIRDFSLYFDNDVDENGILKIDAKVILNSPIRYYTINKTDFPEMTREEFIAMCDEIKKEIEEK